MRTITSLKKALNDYKKGEIVIDASLEPKEEKGFIDETNVCMFIPKKEKFKETLKKAEGFEEYKKIPELVNENYQTCGFSTDYLELLLVALKKSKNDRVKLTIAKDYPMIAETEDFKFILAPNVRGDD